jgi:glycosyltransferase involved in cell wall biosynthesis
MGSRLPALSLVIVATDHARYLPGLFASLRAHCMGMEEVEVVFVDNASKDDSLVLGRIWADGLECAGIRIVGLDRRMEPGEAREAGLARASGDVLLCLEGDCLLTGRYLRECLGDGLNRKGRDIVLTGYAKLGGAEATAAAPVEQGCPDGPYGHVVLMRRCAWESLTGQQVGGCAVLQLDKPLYFSRSPAGDQGNPRGPESRRCIPHGWNGPSGGSPEAIRPVS